MSGDRLLTNVSDGLKDMREMMDVVSENLAEYQERKQNEARRIETGDDIDAEGCTSDIAYAWRLSLPGTTATCVVYFTSEPDYATVKAFARAAGVPAVNVKAEHRPDGE